MEANTLTHHGILGMKWGVRRFQNKDGTLTKAGKKRYADDDDDQKENNQSGSGSSSAPKTKSVKDMTDDEIYEAIARAQLEDRLTALRPETGGAGRTKSMSEMSSRELAEAIQRKQLENQWQAMNPRQVSAGEKFAKTVMTKVVAPAAMKAGEQFLNKALVKAGDKLLGEKANVDSVDALRKTAEKLELQKRIKDLKNPKKDDNEKLKKEFEKIQLEKGIEELNNPSSTPKTKSWDDMLKRQQYEDAKATEGARRVAANAESWNKAYTNNFHRSKTREEYYKWRDTKQEYDFWGDKLRPDNDDTKNSKSDSTPKTDTKSKTEEKTVFGGTVEGVGRTTKKHGFDFVEAEGWTETAKSYTSGSNSNVADQGQIFVNSFLGLPLKED